MAKIIVNEGETIDSAIRRWKKRVMNDGDLYILREKEYFVSKGEKNREKKRAAIRAQQIANSISKRYEY